MITQYDTYKETLPKLNTFDSQHTIVFVVDMVKGFLEFGNLHDSSIQQCIEPIKKLLQSSKHSIFVIDEHEEDAIEFQSFPLHCIKGTKEVEVVDALQPYATTQMKKNSTNAFFSFDFQKFLKSELWKSCESIIVTGCCSDICILQFVLSLRAYCNQNQIKKRIIVPADCVDTYHIPNVHDANLYNYYAFEMMKLNGIEVVASIEVEDRE